MTARERAGLRVQIVSYMEYHPLRATASHTAAGSFGPYAKYATGLFTSRILRFRGFRVAIGAVALMFFIAVPLVAEQSLPGDTLYPIKVRFNEGIHAQLLFSPYEKMQWEARRVERRIAEARLLVQEGKLTEERENALEETVRSHTTAFQAQLAELRESDTTGAVVAEVTLESALDVQSAVLNTELQHEASSTSPNEGNVSGIAAIVREARADVASSTDAAGDDSASCEPLSARVEENTTRIQALLQSLGSELSEAQKAEIQGRTSVVERDIRAAKKARAAHRDTLAIPLLRSALATTEKLIAFMSSFDLRSNVPLDTLVPQEVPNDEPRTETDALMTDTETQNAPEESTQPTTENDTSIVLPQSTQ